MVIKIDKHSDNCVTIGTINFVDTIGEETVGIVDFQGQLGECDIDVYDSEGQIPHFHIVSKKGKVICVKIYEADYFNHGFYKDKLNADQRKTLDSWLRIGNEGVTNWGIICHEWDRLNPDCLFPESSKCATQPNYRSMR